MPYTIEDFRRDYARENLHKMTPEERLEGLSPEELIKGLSPEAIERLRAILDQKQNGDPPEENGEKESN